MLYLGRHARWHSRRNLNARYLRRETLLQYWLRNALAPQDRTGSPPGRTGS
ncbi:MAG: hypothetical protein HC862_16675 [Scytonema sp. RU_4_4]|nr:hypothetical protein [Scytonema sp. RU_4_4]